MQYSNLNVRDLPVEDLRELGLFKDGEINLPKNDIDALLSGMRTSLIKLNNVIHSGVEVQEMNVKLSLAKNSDGKAELLVHPVYKQSIAPKIISSTEADDLITGLKANLIKETVENGQNKKLMVEYDWDTREFIVTDTSRLRVPEMVNGIPLTPYQKERYANGRQIEMPDGTTFQASSATPDGIRSNRLALVVSLLMDGGISYLLLTGLKAMVGDRGLLPQKDERNENYHKALQAAAAQKSTVKNPEETTSAISNNNEYSRGYGRSGVSR
ncbi:MULTISPECIES: DUF4099 domain-containing protein [Pedobacter]|uniref:DUF4099 domain-containing protein n=1 Tax=Pedobacter suwonensis TaxID=332999 RepID=A0A1I0TVH7_9SPHI|nr:MULTISPECIES: DUF4099 domain-containing protein [Pedobacter]SFA54936.1 Protein of unknown function [Pedobacter suwonensis]